MAGLNSILELAKRSLNANQYGIGVTSHNISNASVPGYSRQRLNLAASVAEKTQFGYVGTGVTIQTVQRLRESYIDQQIYTVNANLGNSAQRGKVLQLAESFFQEPSDSGLNAMMQGVFNAFQNLSTHPEESSSRNAVLQKAAMMTDSFHRVADGLKSMKADSFEEINSKVEKINSLIKTISDLNATIAGASAQGLKPNDVMDQRDTKLAELSKLVNLRVTEDKNGFVTASIAGTTIIANGTYTEVKANSAGSSIVITPANSSMQVNVTEGELGGLLTLYNSTIPGYQTKLDDVAQSIITEVNTVHMMGYGLGTPPPTGMNFFSGTDASTIDVDPFISQNINTIAASKDGSPGNNEIATQIAELQNKKVLNGSSNTIFQYYNGMVSNLGSEIEGLNTDVDSHNLVLNQLDVQQNSVAGVSLDEEMTNLIKFQHGFDASARIINAVNEMYKTIIDMV